MSSNWSKVAVALTALIVLATSGAAANTGNPGEDRYAEDFESDSAAPKKGKGPKFPGVGSMEAWQAALPNMQEGLQLMRQAQWDPAINHFRAALALYPYEPRCWMQIGRALEAKGANPSDIEDAYRNALKLDSNNWRGWKRLANVLYTEKRYSEARQSISNAMNMNVPPRARDEMDKMIRMIDSGEKGANTENPI